MRELRVIGLDSAGENVICQDPATGEKFSIPADDRLRAGARRDLTRLGQIEIETESQLRPREIQARIRAGASVTEVATQAGIPESRVERFAHPVLLERSRAAELAMGAHPVRAEGPSSRTLSEVVAAAFGARGHNPEDVDWDAWKSEEGHWVAQLRWRTGRSDNTAHWRFQRDGHGGTVVALDDAATELVDPDFTRPLRTLATVAPLTATEVPPEIHETVLAAAGAHRSQPVLESKPAESAGEAPQPAATDEVADQVEGADHDTVEVHEDHPEDHHEDHGEHDSRTRRGKNGKPAMPSWEDVLLGVRSSGRG